MKFTKKRAGKVFVGELVKTINEVYVKRNKYEWRYCLVLMDSDGKWLCLDTWRTNAFRKAERELISYGWKKALSGTLGASI